jgi:hypothetical protein
MTNIKTKIKFTRTLLIVAFIFFQACLAAEALKAVPNVNLNPATNSDKLKIGDTFNTTININNVTNLWQWTIAITWDPKVLQVQGTPIEGSFLKSANDTLFLSNPANNTQGRINEISDTLLSYNGVNGTGNLTTITFKVNNYGSTKISIVNCTLQGPNIGTADDPIHQPITYTIDNAVFNLPSPNNGSQMSIETYAIAFLVAAIVIAALSIMIFKRQKR